MRIEHLEVFHIDLPLREPFAAAHGTTTSRELVVVRVETDAGIGWGECSALPSPTYTTEYAAGAFAAIGEDLGPRVVGASIDAVDELANLIGASNAAEAPMAVAGIEMALIDTVCRSVGVSLATWLGSTADSVPAGAAIGLASPSDVAASARTLTEAGFRRLKLKIEPGHDAAVIDAALSAIRSVRSTSDDAVFGTALPDIHVDANGSYSPAHLSQLADLGAMGVSAIEQPFAPGDEGERATAVLIERLAGGTTAVIADEAATSADEVSRLTEAGALTGVSIKPPRLGGILTAVSLAGWCIEAGVPATAGGMLESGLGRHALAAVASLDGFSIPGDLSPAGRWLAEDPWPDLALADGTIAVSTGPGVAPDPDTDQLARYTVDRTLVR